MFNWLYKKNNINRYVDDKMKEYTRYGIKRLIKERNDLMKKAKLTEHEKALVKAMSDSIRIIEKDIKEKENIVLMDKGGFIYDK